MAVVGIGFVFVSFVTLFKLQKIISLLNVCFLASLSFVQDCRGTCEARQFELTPTNYAQTMNHYATAESMVS